MEYPEILRERFNNCMFDERDIIENFLKKQYDIRYGRQRDTWHLEPAVELVGMHGGVYDVHDIKLDDDMIVVFSVDVGDKRQDWECTQFAYGELYKIIDKLPDADKIVRKDAIDDISEQIKNLRIDLLLEESPFNYEVRGNVYNVYNYKMSGDEIRLLSNDGRVLIPDGVPLEMLTAFRDHINIEVLHRSDEYKKVMEILSLEPNLRKSVDEYDKTHYGLVTFIIENTDIEFDVSAIQRDDKGNLTIFGADTGCEDELITLTEKEIRKEYLVEILKWMKPKYCDIIDTYNAHNPELVRKINAAWRDDKYHDMFEGILHALLERDYEEYCDKFEVPEVTTSDYAMNHAHEIMEGVCDDWDLECVLKFIRYEED